MSAKHKLDGKKFGHWTVESHDGFTAGGALWNVVCACGTRRSILATTLVRGRSSSCGCISAAALVERTRKHGKAHTYLYQTWKGVLRRCLNSSDAAFRLYGARGIKVAENWVNDFEAFEQDILSSIGHRPTDDHSLDRVDNDRGYEVGNLRWATSLEQVHNSRMFKTGMQRWTRARLIEEVQRLRRECDDLREYAERLKGRKAA